MHIWRTWINKKYFKKYLVKTFVPTQKKSIEVLWDQKVVNFISSVPWTLKNKSFQPYIQSKYYIQWWKGRNVIFYHHCWRYSDLIAQLGLEVQPLLKRGTITYELLKYPARDKSWRLRWNFLKQLSFLLNKIALKILN